MKGTLEDINRNVIEISRFKAKLLYNAMKPVNREEEKKISVLLEGLKDIAIQIGKNIYPSHYDFITLEYGYFWRDDEKIWVYSTRLDGNYAIIPKRIVEKIGSKSIDIMEIYEASTGRRRPKGGYYFQKPKNDRLLRFKVIVTYPNEKCEITDFKDLNRIYKEVSKAMKEIYSIPYFDMNGLLEINNHYRRDGYL